MLKQNTNTSKILYYVTWKSTDSTYICDFNIANFEYLPKCEQIYSKEKILENIEDFSI